MGGEEKIKIGLNDSHVPADGSYVEIATLIIGNEVAF